MDSLDAILRRLRDAPRGHARERAAGQAWVVLQPRFIVMAQRAGLQRSDAEDVASTAFARVCAQVDQCRGLDEPADAAEKVTWGWAVVILRHAAADWHRRAAREAKRKAELAKADKGPVAPRPTLDGGHFDEAIAVATAAITGVVATGLPPDVREVARQREVASAPDRLRRDIDCFVSVRVRGRDSHQLARALGYAGPEKRLRDRVAKHVQRGAAALRTGAELALSRGDQDATELLEELRDRLATPLKPGRPAS